MLVEGVEGFLTQVHPVQRRHGNEHMAGGNHRAEVFDKKRAQQGGDVQAIRVGIGKDADLVITQAVQLVGTRIHANGHGNIVHFLGRQDLARVHFPGVQDLAPQRHHRLELAVPGLFGRATGGVTFHQKQFRAGGIAAGTVRQLAGQGRAGGHSFARNLLAGPQATLGIADKQLGQGFSHIGMLVQPEAEGILDHAGYKRSRFP